MRIAIQGEKGSFHEVAARQYFKNTKVDIVPFPTFDTTIDSLKLNKSDIVIIAIENARSGSLLYNYSLIRESGLQIIGEHIIRISQNLMALSGQTIENITEIWSHPVAISQCMRFLNRYPHITLKETDDTAASAKEIREKELMSVAAIGSNIASNIYNLPILAKGIETYEKNYTKFLIVGNKEKYCADANKASVCFSLGHEPGSLAKLLVILAEMDINLTKIQSVPKPDMGWEYLFYLELEFEVKKNITEFMNVLDSNTNNLEILGVYKKGDKLYESKDS